MSCDKKNVIYVITCPGCKEFYIGETENTLRARVRVHKQHINTPEYVIIRKFKVRLMDLAVVTDVNIRDAVI